MTRDGLRLLLGFAVILVAQASAAPLLDDHAFVIQSPADVTRVREELIRFVWGETQLPRELPGRISRGVVSPVKPGPNFGRVDEIEVAMESGQRTVAYHFIPESRNGRLVVVHQGHGCGLDSLGVGDHIRDLLCEGYSVLGMYMPKCRPGDCQGSCTGQHEAMFATLRPAVGSPMKFFLEPIVVCLNYLESRHAADDFPRYAQFHMAGLSGGGWTTTIYAALDPRISMSFPVAGTMPLHLRSGGSVGDIEQTIPVFYQLAGYPDLYVLGSYGPGRRQAQVLNRRDDCCFGAAQHAGPVTYDQAVRAYERRVRERLFQLGLGSFRLEIDEAAGSHMISQNTSVNVILAELNQGRRQIGAGSGSEVYVRGVNGHLWSHRGGEWMDTGLAAAGAPAVVQDQAGRSQVFFRDPANRLRRGFRTSGGWSEEDMGGVVVSDPAATALGSGSYAVVAVGGNAVVYCWLRPGDWAPISLTNKAMGLPAILATGTNELHVFFRDQNREVCHAHKQGASPWRAEKLGGEVLDSPSAVALSGDTLRVYARGINSGLWEASKEAVGTWTWRDLSEGRPMDAVAGSPSATLVNGTIVVHARQLAGDGLVSYTRGPSGWTISRQDRRLTGSPVAVAGSVFIRGEDCGLWEFAGSRWVQRKGIFD